MDYSASRKHLLQHRLFPFQGCAPPESPCRSLGGPKKRRMAGWAPPSLQPFHLPPPFQDWLPPQARRRRTSLLAKWQPDSATNLQTESANYTSQPAPLPECRAVHAGISTPPDSPKDECVSWLNPSSAQLAPSALRERKAEHASPPHSRPHTQALPPGRLRESNASDDSQMGGKDGCEAAPSPAEAQSPWKHLLRWGNPAAQGG